MSLAAVRHVIGRVPSNRHLLTANKNASKAIATLYTGTDAQMTAVYGDKFGYAKPYPYESKRLNTITEWFDCSIARMNGNSKVITVDGNLACGKNKFAKELARNFDLKYFPSINNNDLFIVEGNNFNKRELNSLLPYRSQFYDLDMWNKEEDLSNGFIGAAQLEFYTARFKQACDAMLHLFSTGNWI